MVALDSANIAVIKTSPSAGLQTDTSGAATTFNVTLNSKPIANVTLPVSSSNTSQGTVSVSSLTFTPSNWNTPQPVTVTGVVNHVAGQTPVIQRWSDLRRGLIRCTADWA